MEEKKEKKKNYNMTIIGVIILVLVIAIGGGIIIFNRFSQKEPSDDVKNNEKTNYNTNTGVVEDKIINNILFSDIECSFDGNYSLLTYKITNQSNETMIIGDYEITVKDKSDNVLANMVLSITEELEPNESIDSGNAIDIDLREAYQIELADTTE